MQRNADNQILTGERVSNDTRAFYVSVLNSSGRDYRLALGPFATQLAAKVYVREVMRYSRDTYRDGVWYAYGTCGMSGNGPYPTGILNEALGIAPDVIVSAEAPPPALQPVHVGTLLAEHAEIAERLLRALRIVGTIWQITGAFYAYAGPDGYYYAVSLPWLAELGRRLDSDENNTTTIVADWTTAAPRLQLTETPHGSEVAA